MEFSRLIWLHEPDCKQAELVGNKAANLAKLVSYGYSVPNGFAVVPRPSPQNLSLGESIEFESALQKLSTPVVARSSGKNEDGVNRSYAGMYETVIGLTSIEDCLKAVEKVANSGGSTRVRKYARQSGHESGTDIQTIPVLCQEMIACEVSGVAFSRDPVTGEDKVIIEASFGLGQLLVEGSITPDLFEVKGSEAVLRRLGTKSRTQVWSSGEIKTLDTNPEQKKQPALSNSQLQEISALAKAIEKDLKFPQDIEWGIKGNQLYIFQARPISTVPPTL